ncbi:NAD(P)/FAD-dependent oxidoreductase [Candidatus Woesearchaeota archaeon]|nr:NAD(P)/FAD-dependent oxidoreductase [Candidatus Woesearchaeota archaeon]
MKKEVIIIGAGPAGLSAAEILAKEGKDVLVLEKKEVIGDKVCAGGLTLKNMKLVPESLYQRTFKKIIVHAPKDSAEIKMKKPFLATIDRKDLGKWLAKKARKAGAEIQAGTAVNSIGNNFIKTKEKIYFKNLIGADGANSIVRKHLKLQNKKVLAAFQYIVPKRFKNLELFFDADKFGPSYAWIFPYSKTTSIGSGADLDYKLKTAAVKKSFDKWCKQFNMENSEFQAHTINYDYQGHKFGKIFLAGDAGGFASGLTGEGMYQAIISGQEVAKTILDPNHDPAKINKILFAKAVEEATLHSLEISSTLTKIEHYLLIDLIKAKWMNKALVKHI